MIHAAKSFLTRTVLPAALVVATAYNGILMVNGPDGRRAEAILRAEIAEAEATLDTAKTRTAELSERADGLMLGSLDRDLLEERLRIRMGLTRPDEYMVRMQDLDRIAGTPRAEPEARFAELKGREAGAARPRRR